MCPALASHLISIQEASPLFQTPQVGKNPKGMRAFLRRPGICGIFHLPDLWQCLSWLTSPHPTLLSPPVNPPSQQGRGWLLRDGVRKTNISSASPVCQLCNFTCHSNSGAGTAYVICVEEASSERGSDWSLVTWGYDRKDTRAPAHSLSSSAFHRDPRLRKGGRGREPGPVPLNLTAGLAWGKGRAWAGLEWDRRRGEAAPGDP